VVNSHFSRKAGNYNIAKGNKQAVKTFFLDVSTLSSFLAKNICSTTGTVLFIYFSSQNVVPAN